MNIELIKNPDTGVMEAWEDGRVVGEFISTGMPAQDMPYWCFHNYCGLCPNPSLVIVSRGSYQMSREKQQGIGLKM